MTLLENILLVDNKQGGTIHDYIKDYGNKKTMELAEALQKDYYNDNVAISYHTLNHYANNRGVWINWSNYTTAFYEGK